MLPGIAALSPRLTFPFLTERLRQAMAFASAAVRDSLDGREAWRERIGESLILADKVPVEAALLLLLAARVGAGGGEELAEMLDPLIRSDRNRMLMARLPRTVAFFGMGHLALTCAGRPDAEFDEVVRAAFRDGLADAWEKPPNRQMELQWLRAQLFDERVSMSEAIRASILSSNAHPILMSSRDAYAVTHAIMYASDFGRDASAIPDGAAALVDACIAEQLLEEDFDLLAELLLCASALGRPWSRHARCAWAILDGVWSEYGFLPTRSAASQDFASLDERERTSYVFRHTYHTTLMGGDLCALLLRHPEQGGEEPPAVPHILWKQVRPRLDEHDANVETLNYLRNVPKDDVTGPVLDALLIRVSRKFDLAALGELAAYCDGLGHRSPTVEAVRALIRRTASARSPATPGPQ
ncbi:MAG TPA: hypothetical protein VI670_20360 [Thermoanaerobaculia bacterium]